MTGRIFKDGRKYPLMMYLNKDENDMLLEYARKERRAKSNAALILLRDALLRLKLTGNNNDYDIRGNIGNENS